MSRTTSFFVFKLKKKKGLNKYKFITHSNILYQRAFNYKSRQIQLKKRREKLFKIKVDFLSISKVTNAKRAEFYETIRLKNGDIFCGKTSVWTPRWIKRNTDSRFRTNLRKKKKKSVPFRYKSYVKAVSIKMWIDIFFLFAKSRKRESRSYNV